ncbi:GntR family transcriptional regulator [Sedimentitalea todarodis]|uniref:GntR family transcriptional regulator n=1 Tax=Sedimentitalea todarodis TaxID=1631240 RepID=A0ABU3VHK4_9RHOB|nr:GntR family transcriptional regulator [Sedimentitalea todarodis]MDU9005645.1 GntR family transcriptional regulator [Sedimentitalea todarodis]
MTKRVETTDIYEDLRVKLTTAHFAPGAKLKPSDLQPLYGRSANTVREVLFRLSTVGLVLFEDQRGFRVPPSEPQKQNDLTSFRITLEQEGATQSMRNGGIEWEARLTAAHHKLSHIENRIGEAGDIAAVLFPWCAAEWEFHETLVSASDSPLLRSTFQSVYDQFRQQLVTNERNYGYFPKNVAEHSRIVECALSGSAEGLRQAIYDHLSRNLLVNQAGVISSAI